MPLQPGDRLGPYEIVAPLGAGGMGEVYQARDTRLDRTVAIKILPAHLSDDEAARQRLEREARAVSSLNHPNICILHDIGRHGETDYLVMEHLEGETLAERLASGPLPPAELLRFGVQVADALDKAHRRGVVHRDLKPGNVMLTKGGAKLLDFGLAKLGLLPSTAATVTPTALPTNDRTLTAQGMILGTYPYMAPEQLEGQEADSRSDIFAMGALLFEMATGRRAFEGKSQASVIAAVLERNPPRISDLRPGLPAGLEAIVQTCLRKDPDERWQSSHDVLLQLQALAEGGPEVVPSRPATTRPHRAWAVATVLGLLLVASLGALLLQSRRPAEGMPRLHASISPPEGIVFRFLGDLAGPATLSPDGRRLAFTGTDPQGVSRLVVRSLQDGTARVLTGTEGASFPFWSPDGRALGFFVTGELRRVDADGGPVVRICAAPQGRGGSWNEDGRILFSPDFTDGLYQVDAGGGTPEPVLMPDGVTHTTFRWPWFLPDGEHFLFVGLNHASPARDGDALLVGSLSGEGPVRLLPTSAAAIYASGRLLYLRGRTLMSQPFDPDRREVHGRAVPLAENLQYDDSTWNAVFTASTNGVLAYRAGEAVSGKRLLWYDRDGTQRGSLGERGGFLSLSLSPDGRQLVTDDGPHRDLWIYDLARNVRTRFTYHDEDDVMGVWTPDGRTIYFSSARDDGTLGIYRQALGASEAEPVLTGAENQYLSDLSRDGKYVLYVQGGFGDAVDLWVATTDGSAEPRALVATPYLETGGAFSPDGSLVAYMSGETGTAEVYLLPFPGPGPKVRVSDGGGALPRWRRDGKELFYWSYQAQMMAVPVTSGEGGVEVGTPKALFPVVLDPQFYAYDVTPDGRRFLIAIGDDDSSVPLTLVVGWDLDL